MCGRQVVHLAPNGTDLIGFPAVEPYGLIQDNTAHGFFLHIMVIFAYESLIHFSFFPGFFMQSGQEFLLHPSKGLGTGMLVIVAGTGNLQGSIIGLIPHALFQVLVVDLVAVFPFFFLACGFGQGLLGLAHGLDRIMGELDGFQHFCFAYFLHFAFHHHDVLIGGTHHDVDIRFFQLLKGGIDHQFTVNASHPSFGNGPVEVDVRNGHGRRCSQSGQCIRRGVGRS